VEPITDTAITKPPHNRPGQWKPGQVTNPNGHNGKLKGYQPFGKRILYWLENFDGYQIRALYLDKLRFYKLNPLDQQCVTSLYDTVHSLNRSEVHERFLTRMEGAPKGSTDVNVNVNGEIRHTHAIEETTKRLLESRIAGLTERNGEGLILEQSVPDGGDSPAVRLEQFLGETKTAGSDG